MPCPLSEDWRGRSVWCRVCDVFGGLSGALVPPPHVEGLEHSHKVTPAFKTVRKGSSRAHPNQPAWKAKLAAHLWKHARIDEQAKSDAKELCLLKEQRLSAHHFILALDHMLETVGIGLRRFVVPAAARSRPLELGEQRVTVPGAARNSAQVGATPGGRDVVINKATGARRWEAEKYSGSRPTLALYVDHGSDVTAAACFMIFQLGLRVSVHSDVFHDASNDMSLAAQRAGFAPLMQETTFLFNFEHGPWQSKSNWRKVAGGFSEFVSSVGASDDLFAELYDKFCTDQGEIPVGSVEYWNYMLQCLWEGEAFEKTCERVGMSRCSLEGRGLCP